MAERYSLTSGLRTRETASPAPRCCLVGCGAETGCKAVIEELLRGRRFEFSVERAVFLTVLHRLVVSGSDRACEYWRDDYRLDGVGELDLHHLYRAMAWLGEELPASDQADRTLAPRCIKDLIEERLFEQRRDLLSDLSVVFMDTTTLYFEGQGGQTLGPLGHSKDYRPHQKQMVISVIMDQDGRPVCSEMWPGDTADVTRPGLPTCWPGSPTTRSWSSATTNAASEPIRRPPTSPPSSTWPTTSSAKPRRCRARW